MTRKPDDARRLEALIGLAAIAFSVLYLASDLIELIQGRFSTPQLVLTYVAEAAIPLFVLGPYAVQTPRIGWLGLVGAVTYAYTFVFFTSTVMYAPIEHTNDWNALKTRFGAWMTVHSILMIFAGLTFGAAVVRAAVLAPWTGATLIAGMVLMTVTRELARRLANGLCGRAGSRLRRHGRLAPATEAPQRCAGSPQPTRWIFKTQLGRGGQPVMTARMRSA